MSGAFKFGIIPGSFGIFMHYLSFWAFNVHNSNLNYKHMLQCTKVCWKITCVSLGEFIGAMQEMGMKFKHLGVVAQLGRLRNLVFLIPVNPKHTWKSWNLAWYHDMAPTCCSNFFGRIGTSFGTSFLQIGASLKKARGSERERVTFVCIIQILNTSTCSSAPKLVEKSHVCPRVNF